MSMSLSAAQERLRKIRDDALAASTGSNQVLAYMNLVVNGLNAIQGSGIAPERMPSTQALANEIQRIQGEQRSRVFSLLQGIEAMM